MRQRMSDAPFSVVEECQIEIIHAEVVSGMEEIMRGNDSVGGTPTGNEHQEEAVVFGRQNCKQK